MVWSLIQTSRISVEDWLFVEIVLLAMNELYRTGGTLSGAGITETCDAAKRLVFYLPNATRKLISG